jgi:hypothetical protein
MGMDNQSQIDRGILIPLVISVFSVIGICIVLVIAYSQNDRLAPGMPATSGPQQSQPREDRSFLPEMTTATQEIDLTAPPEELDPVIETQDAAPVEETSTPALPPTESLAPAATSTQPDVQDDTEPPASSTPAPPATSSPVTVTNAAGPTQDQSELFLAGKYDNNDARIEYEGDWTSELFVDGAYEETLSISTSTGNTATFIFVGNRIELGYFGYDELGTAIITIDGTAYPPVNQANGSTWLSPQLAAGQHSVVIRHQSGDMVCVDYIDVRGQG